MKKVLITLLALFIMGCQSQQTEMKITCQNQELEYIELSKDEYDFSKLMNSCITVEEGDAVTTNIKNNDTKVSEYILNEDGTRKYTDPMTLELKISNNSNVSFEVSKDNTYMVDSSASGEKHTTFRGYIIETDDERIGIVLKVTPNE